MYKYLAHINRGGRGGAVCNTCKALIEVGRDGEVCVCVIGRGEGEGVQPPSVNPNARKYHVFNIQ